MTATRNRYLDILSGISVILVILFGTGVVGSKGNDVINTVCPFIFLAAFGAMYKSTAIKDVSYEEFVKRTFIGLIIPYIIFCLLGTAKDALLMILGAKDKAVVYLKDDLYNSLSLKGIYYTGFLSMYFIAVNGYVLIRKKCNMVVTGIIASLCFAYIVYVGYNGEMLNGEVGSAKSIMTGVCYTCFRAIEGIVFIFFGEILEGIFSKNEKRRAALGALGIVFVIGGSFIALNNKIVRSFIFVWGNPGLFILSAILLIAGIMMIARWIAEFKLLEMVGTNGKLIYLLFFTAGINEIQRIISDKIFELSDNNFMSRSSSLLITLLFEVVIIWICQIIAKGKNDK